MDVTAVRPPRVVVAPDKFKGSANASEVAAHLTSGLHRARPDLDVVSVPLADGGDGTVLAAVSAGFEAVPVTVTGPDGNRLRAHFARRGHVAIVESALATSMSLVRGRPDPLTATSRGVGELVRAALDAGCTEIVVGVGGTATTDGGAGMLQALGVRVSDDRGRELAAGGAELARAHRVDLARLDLRLDAVDVVVACDVDNPLTGPSGAAHFFGAQKGASAEQRTQLDRALARWGELVDPASVRTAGAGAGGGLGFAAVAALHGRFRPGVELVLDLVGFDRIVDRADLVITGKGRLDAQTAHGKVVAGVAARARDAGVPTVAACGRCTIDGPQINRLGLAGVLALSDWEPDEQRCMADAPALLDRAGQQIARQWFGQASR